MSLGADTVLNNSHTTLATNPKPKLWKSGNVFNSTGFMTIDGTHSIATGKCGSAGIAMQSPDFFNDRIPYRIHGECHTSNGGVPYGFLGILPATIGNADAGYSIAYEIYFGQVHTSSTQHMSCAFIDELFVIEPLGTISGTDYSKRALCFGWMIYNPHTSTLAIDVKATLSVQNLAVHAPSYRDRRKQ